MANTTKKPPANTKKKARTNIAVAPKGNPLVLSSIENTFSEYTKVPDNGVSKCVDVFSNDIKCNLLSSKNFTEACKSDIAKYNKMLENKELSTDDRCKIIDAINERFRQMQEQNRDDKVYCQTARRDVLLAMLGMVALPLSVYGVKFMIKAS